MVSIKEVAKTAGVSATSVSNALNGKKNISEEKRKMIMDVCREMNYRPNIIGQSLKNGKSNVVAFLFSDFDRSFYLEIIHGMNDYLTQKEYDFIICTSKSGEMFLQNGFTCGAICLDHKLSDQFLAQVADKSYPVVVMDRCIENSHITSVIVDNYPAMYSLVEKLVDKGYRRFAFLGGLQHTLDNTERYKAFTDVLKTRGLLFDDRLYFHGDYREESGYKLAQVIMLEQNFPEVLVCANDNMAIGAIKAFTEKGLKVPENIEVTGFDDCYAAQTLGLTTVSIPRYESGYLAAKALVNMLEKDATGTMIKIKAELMWREKVYEKNVK